MIIRYKNMIMRLVFVLLVVSVVSSSDSAALSETRLIASDGAIGDFLGTSVSISGDTMVVGAKSLVGTKGSAYVFVRNGGVWIEKQKLIPSDGAATDVFGSSVSIDEDTIVVGAYLDDSNKGSAYVFVRNSVGVWTEQQKLTASDDAASYLFGASVSINGDTIVVGTDSYSNEVGSAYVFVRNSVGVWTEQQKLTASDGAAGDHFGYSVSIDEDTIVVGAGSSDGTKGSAYVFVRNSVGVWTEQQKLTASDGAAGDHFGYSVSIDEGTIVVGELHDSNKGSAYVFVRNSVGVWTEQQKLTTNCAQITNCFFGVSVSINGNTIVVGADSEGYDVGSAYIFVRNSVGVWTEQQKLTPYCHDLGSCYFGYSVSINGNTIVVGMPGDRWGIGLVYVFAPEGQAPDTTPPTITAPSAVSAEATGEFTAVTIGTATATDLVDATPTITSDAPTTYPVGETIVTWTATDDAGNYATATQTVTITDTTPPTITAPSAVSAEATGEFTAVTIGTATATDLVDATPTITSDAPASYPVGVTTVTWTATDDAGNSASATQTVTIKYYFTGFFKPVDNPSTVNMVKAGNAIPVKFSLSGNMGLSIFYSGYPKSQDTKCEPNAAVDGIDETVTAGSSSLTYDTNTGQYIYIWKTDKNWANSCRQLVLQLNDFTYHRANFKFSK